jgi:hypothetical protein
MGFLEFTLLKHENMAFWKKRTLFTAFDGGAP